MLRTLKRDWRGCKKVKMQQELVDLIQSDGRKVGTGGGDKIQGRKKNLKTQVYQASIIQTENLSKMGPNKLL